MVSTISKTEVSAKGFIKLAKSKVSHAYHSESETHIYYCLSVGKFGVRGFGVFQDEAYADFERQLTRAVDAANTEDLEDWVKRLTSKPEVKPLENAKPTSARRCEIGIVTSQEVLNSLDKEKGEKSRNAFLEELLRENFRVLTKDSAANMDAMFKRLQSQESVPKEKQVQWVVRVPLEERDSIALFATKYHTKAPQICRLILEEHLQTQANKKSLVARV